MNGIAYNPYGSVGDGGQDDPSPKQPPKQQQKKARKGRPA